MRPFRAWYSQGLWDTYLPAWSCKSHCPVHKGQSVWLLVTQPGDSESKLSLDFTGQCGHGRARLKELCLSKGKVAKN